MARWLLLLLALGVSTPAMAGDVAASAPTDLSVTIYRAPNRNGGSIQLDALGGFAVITETRRVTLPAGQHRLRFEGVVDGIITESAVINGLPGGVIEKNRDAALLSPSALMRASLGREIVLNRTNWVTGKMTMVPAQIIAANEQGITVKTDNGVEALRCSGIGEGASFTTGTAGLSARPTLSVMTRSPRAITATLTLTYIAEGFDWSANYTAAVNPDGKSLDIGGWITLANGNSVSLENARTQIVAGGLNRAYLRRFINDQPVVVARCWPMQQTSDVPFKPDRPYQLVSPWMGLAGELDGAAADEIAVTAQKRTRNFAVPMSVAPPPPPPPPAPEQLGDLKLYRVPQPTTIAAMQMKQTRLLEQHGVPVERIYSLTLPAYRGLVGEQTMPANAMLRTRNDKQHRLGLPLPAGTFVIEQDQYGRSMMVGQPDLSDTAEDEKVELTLGPAPDVNVIRRTLSRNVISGKTNQQEQLEISNASPAPIAFELRLQSWGDQRVSDSDAEIIDDNGIQVMRIIVPGNGRKLLNFRVFTG